MHISLASFFLCKHRGTESVSFVQIPSVKLEPWILFSLDQSHFQSQLFHFLCFVL